MDTLIQTEFLARAGRGHAPGTLNIDLASNVDYNRYLFAKSSAALNKSLLDFPEHARLGAHSPAFGGTSLCRAERSECLVRLAP